MPTTTTAGLSGESVTELLDTIQPVETPEAIHLTLQPAGAMVRGYALGVDFVIKSIALLLLALVLSTLGELGDGLMLIIAFISSWFYNVLFEVLNNGATPGKKVFRLKTVHMDGTPVSWSGSVIRNLLRVADALPVGYGIGLLCSLSNKRFQRLGDLAAGTVVVYRDHHNPVPSHLPDGPSEALPISLTAAEQRSLVDFAARAGLLSQPRQQELAKILAALTQGVADEQAVARLHAYARRCIGQQDSIRESRVTGIGKKSDHAL